MIYIIFNNSYESDGYDSPSHKIEYITIDKEKAIDYFDNHYSNPPKSDKWCYQYELVEFEDGYNPYCIGDTSVPITLKFSSNDNDV